MENENPHSHAVIDALGGTTVLARLIHAPVTTVHAWRKKGIPVSRMAHIKLVAKAEGVKLPTETASA